MWWVLTGLCSQTGLELNFSLMELGCENTPYPHSVSMAWAQDENGGGMRLNRGTG